MEWRSLDPVRERLEEINIDCDCDFTTVPGVKLSESPRLRKGAAISWFRGGKSSEKLWRAS